MQVIENQNRIVCNQVFNEDEYSQGDCPPVSTCCRSIRMLGKSQITKITKLTMNYELWTMNYELWTLKERRHAYGVSPFSILLFNCSYWLSKRLSASRKKSFLNVVPVTMCSMLHSRRRNSSATSRHQGISLRLMIAEQITLLSSVSSSSVSRGVSSVWNAVVIGITGWFCY